jgi:hypothetical protein
MVQALMSRALTFDFLQQAFAGILQQVQHELEAPGAAIVGVGNLPVAFELLAPQVAAHQCDLHR